MTLARQPDLFLSDSEPELFKEQPRAAEQADPHTIRLELQALLDKARAATSMPWPEREARMWQIAFPQMANWLPPQEGDQLRLEFAKEIKRLTETAA